MKFYSMYKKSGIPTMWDEMQPDVRRAFSELATTRIDTKLVFEPFQGYMLGDSPLFIEQAEEKLYEVYDFPRKPNGFLVTASVKALLEKLCIFQPCQFYPAKLNFRGQHLDYFIFMVYLNAFDSVLFEKSQFWVYDMLQRKNIQPITESILDKRHFIQISNKQARFFNLNYGVLTLPHYSDLFYGLDGGFTVSERLKQCFESAQIRGMDFRLLDFEIRFLDQPTI